MQSFATVLLPFDASLADAVDDVLEDMRNPARPELSQSLDALGMIHFMSIAAIRGKGGQDAWLTLEASVDGGVDEALRKIAAKIDEPLMRLLRAAQLDKLDADLATFLIAHKTGIGQDWFAGRFAKRLGLTFSGSPGLTVRRIIDEKNLTDRIAHEHAALLAEDHSPLHKLREVRRRLWSAGDAKWAFFAEWVPWTEDRSKSATSAVFRTAVPLLFTFFWPLLPLQLLMGGVAGWWTGRELLHWLPMPLNGFAAIVLGLLAGLIGFVILPALLSVMGLGMLRERERTDIPDDTTPDAEDVGRVMTHENFTAQNLLATVSVMKPGMLRRNALRIALLTVNRMAISEFRPGYLGDIGVIHFARWVLMPDGKSLAFWSNYDGSLESYLEDFIERAHQGVSAIWSNTVGFPRTNWLFIDGAKDGDRLRRFVLRQQYPARFWYSAYPSLTLARIRANAIIRQGIAAARTDEEAEQWLGCFTAAPRFPSAAQSNRPQAVVFHAVESRLSRHSPPPAPMPPLEKDEIPTLVFGARSKHIYSTALMVELNADDPAACCAWLRQIEPQVTYGNDKRGTGALVVAFAASAFERTKVPLDAADLKTFPPAFLNGMTKPWRSRALGDEDDNAPEKWDWGNKENPADVVLVAYDKNEHALRTRVDALVRGATALGHKETYRLDLAPVVRDAHGLPTEPFGFADGVSQPLIRGIDGRSGRDSDQVLAPGEFVLGYPDNRDYLPSTPMVLAARDPHGLLPPFPGDPLNWNDLGHNGTFLAVRQLEQDKARFDAWLDQAATTVQGGNVAFSSLPAAFIREIIAAKVVGRWRNGSSVTQHPVAPGPSMRNGFRYGDADADGMSCPLGAHARRANPRDSFDPGSPAQLAITNRHRILRVGRKYDLRKKGGKTGLLFMCLNAEISRQFEFVQQTWLLGSTFLGLRNEADISTGQAVAGQCSFSIPTRHGAIRLSGVRPVTAVKGGGYFFMPGRRAFGYLARLA